MYAYEDSETITPVPEITATSSLLPIPEKNIEAETFSLLPVPENRIFKSIDGIDINGNTMAPMGMEGTAVNDNELVTPMVMEGTAVNDNEPVTPPDAGQYLPSLTSPTIPFLGDQLEINA